MFRRGLSLCLILSMASVSFGGARITLVPTTPAPHPVGSHVSVDIMLSQEGEGAGAMPRFLRMAQVDYSDTPSGLGVTAPVWALAGLPACGGSANCNGSVYYIDSDLSPASFGDKTASMAYYFQNEANLGPNANAQITVPASGSVRIGTLDVTCSTAGTHNLNVINGDAPDQNTGAVIYWGFGILVDNSDPVRIFRAGNAAPNNLLGGTLSIPCGGPPPVIGSTPASCTTANGAGSSLWRTEDNLMLIDFAGPVTVPGPGQIEINEILAGGLFGPNLNTGGNFTITVEGGGTRLRILENSTAVAPILQHRHWYAYRNTGAWTAAANFSIKVVVQMGDATNDGRVLAGDVSAINACIPCPNVNNGCASVDCLAPQTRRDITGDNRIIAGDVSSANAHVPSTPVNIPTGNTCP